jgi:hypothetical protein
MEMTRHTAVFTWAALLVVPFAFLAVTFNVVPVGPSVPSLAGPVLALAAAASAVNVALAFALPARLGPAVAHDRDAVAFARALVSLALGEAAALAPVVARMITRDARLLAVFAADVAALAALYPSRRRWAGLLPRGETDLHPAGPAARRREAR